MLQSTVITLTLAGGGAYTFPTGFKSLGQLVYASDDGNVFDPDFLTDGVYTLIGNTITYDAQYTGTVDQYFTYEDGKTYTDPNGKTLDQLILITAGYAGLRKKVVKTDGAYVGEAALIVDVFVDGFNTAMNMISKRVPLTTNQDITLDDTLQFDVTTLPGRLVKIKSVNPDTDWQWATTSLIKFPDNSSGDVITLEFSYLPDDFDPASLGAVFPFPEGVVSPQLICYFAAYLYFKSKNDDRQDNWLELWNDGYDRLSQNRGEVSKIKDVMGISDLF